MIKFIICIFFATSIANANDFSEANMLYRQAIMLYSDGSYKEAAEKMEDIEKKSPDYPQIKKVLMNEAFFLYLEEKYPEAAALADNYIELYRNDEYLPYLYFLKASALQKRKKSPTKEYHLIQKNIDSWNELIANDNGLYRQEARFRIEELEEMQCLHELRIGDFYLSSNDYFSAIRRFNTVLQCKSKKYYIEASKRLILCYKAIKIPNQVEKYQDIINSEENYTTPEELTFNRSVKNFLFDMVPDFGFLPNWLRVVT